MDLMPCGWGRGGITVGLRGAGICLCSDQFMKKDALKIYVNLRDSLLAEKARLETRLQAINVALGEAKAKSGRGGPRNMSAAARARISAAQKKRWAKIHAAQKKAAQ